VGRHRSRLEIAADILSVVSGNDAGKTRIMSQARLSWDLLNRYLSELMEVGLVSFGSSDRYVLTPKGRRFLDRFGEYSKRLERVERELRDVRREGTRLESFCFNAEGGGGR